MDEELIQDQVTALFIACRRLSAPRLEALRHGCEQACLPPSGFGWDRRAAAYAEIFNMLADTARNPAQRRVLNTGAGLVHHLMMAAGPAADRVVASSRRLLLACFRAGDTDGAASVLESELRILLFMARLTRPRGSRGRDARRGPGPRAVPSIRTGKRRVDVMETADAQPCEPPEAAPSAGRRPLFVGGLARFAGGSALDGPYGLLAVEAEHLAAGDA